MGVGFTVMDDGSLQRYTTHQPEGTEADMEFYEDLDTELKSSFLNKDRFFSNVQDESLFPQLGLRARNLLDQKQMGKLTEIRKRHLKKAHQQSNFTWD
ncbi:hypothetical protein LPTSP4_25710 [Leptospira ryugenii]|uniref:Uncharacterized protein n=1 Tax=Leptospira ryugenii TaxID=1917863 RepID=A0A2P2E2E5_9LEPT|nr:hypothetical protein LPTSP4_25710 [Leptospira ryugenii]